MTDDLKQPPAYQPSLHDHLELAFVRCLGETKKSLDAHMEVYLKKPDGTRSVGYDEAISISVVARIAYESAAVCIQIPPMYKHTIQTLSDKHKLCLKLCEKLIDDLHHNNIIVDHPRSDATKFGIGITLFLTALHHCLKERTPKEHRRQHAEKFMTYRQHCHEDDPHVRVIPLVH